MPDYEMKCVNGHDRCYLGPSDNCPYCEKVEIKNTKIMTEDENNFEFVIDSIQIKMSNGVLFSNGLMFHKDAHTVLYALARAHWEMLKWKEAMDSSDAHRS